MTTRNHREAPEMAGMIRRVLKALARRGDENALEALVSLRADLDAAIGDAARNMHDSGWSWTEVGAAVGVTRQAARQAYSVKAAPTCPTCGLGTDDRMHVDHCTAAA